MAQITINIPDGVLTRVLNAFVSRFDYNSNKQVGETQPQFAKRMLINVIKEIVKGEEAKTAVESSRSDVDANVDIS